MRIEGWFLDVMQDRFPEILVHTLLITLRLLHSHANNSRKSCSQVVDFADGFAACAPSRNDAVLTRSGCWAALMTGPHSSVSALRWRASSSGVEPTTATPICSILSRIAGSASNDRGQRLLGDPARLEKARKI